MFTNSQLETYPSPKNQWPMVETFWLQPNRTSTTPLVCIVIQQARQIAEGKLELVRVILQLVTIFYNKYPEQNMLAKTSTIPVIKKGDKREEQPWIKIGKRFTSIGPAEASLLPSNSDRTSKACSFQSKVWVTTTLAKQTLAWTCSRQSQRLSIVWQ